MMTYFFGVIKQYTTLATQLQMSSLSSFKQFHVFFPSVKIIVVVLGQASFFMMAT